MPNDTLRVTLRLKTIDHLFQEPDLSPFDPYYQPYSFAAGMDYLVGEMQRRPGAKRTELTVLLPPDQVTPELATGAREAIARYSEAWAASARQTREIERSKGWKVLGVAALFFAIANVVYLRYGQTGSLFGFSGLWLDVLIEGLSVGAWVALWWPLDQLLHAGWQYRLDERAYRALQGIVLHVSPDPAPPGVAGVAEPLPAGVSDSYCRLDHASK